MLVLPDGLKADVKLGFGIGIGLLVLGFVLMIVQFLISKAR